MGTPLDDDEFVLIEFVSRGDQDYEFRVQRTADGPVVSGTVFKNWNRVDGDHWHAMPTKGVGGFRPIIYNGAKGSSRIAAVRSLMQSIDPPAPPAWARDFDWDSAL